MTTTTTLPPFDHILAMSDDLGTFEHADHAEPRSAHGYCTDDMARVLVAIARDTRPEAEVRDLGRRALRFVADAQDVSGRVRNRRTPRGGWEDRPGVEDCWGRSIWGFGTAFRRAPEAWVRQSALAYFERGIAQRSPWRRAMAFAALGAAEVLDVEPRHIGACKLLTDAVATIGPLADDADWPWPEDRLTYANAVLPEALIAAGACLERPDVLNDGLTLLRWLLARETIDGHLSPTPVGGAGPNDGRPRFDQQPIEVASMADACARAAAVTDDPSWRRGVELAIDWFAGANDTDVAMWDPLTAGGYDGLQAQGPNLNQGTESTLALISTRQHAHLLASAAQ